MKSETRKARFAALVVLAALAAAVLPAAAEPATVRVDAVVEGQGVRIQAQASAPFEFATYRPNDTLFVVDFAGVSTAAPGTARVLKSEVVSSYRVLQYRAGERSIVRLEVLLRTPVTPRVEREAADRVVLYFGETSAAASAPANAAPQAAAAAAPVAAAPTPAPGPARRGDAIRTVEVARVDGGARVLVTGNGQMRYEALRLENPARLVLDFEGARLATPARAVPSAVEPVKGVRLGQYKPDVARVVIDLSRESSYTVSSQGSGVVVSFASARAEARPEPSPEREAAAERAILPSQGTAKPVTVEFIPVTPAPKQEPAVEEPAREEPAREIPRPSGMTGALAALPLAAPPSAAVVQEPAANQAQPKPAAPVVLASPRGAGSEPPAARPAPYVPQTGRYTGEPISVNFKDLDVKDFFRVIHEISGLNVVVDQNVRGQLTLVMDEVPWDQVLDIVLTNFSLDKQIEGNVLRVATRDTLRREAEARRDLSRAQDEAVEQVITTRVLSYAKASTLRPTLQRFLSARGEILADDRSNTLIIRDIPSTLPQLDNLIGQLDRKSQQVEIEARVVAASRSFAREIGTQFGFATTSTDGRSVFGGLTGAANFGSPVSTGPALPPPPLVVSGTTSLPLNSNLGASAPNSGATFAHRSPNFALDFIISAAESRGVGKLLSKPRVITQNNEKASVKQGTKIPVQTVVNNTISVQFFEAVLKLDVTPQITADGTVFMDVVVENTAIDAGIPRVNNIPALSTQEATTRVTVADGETVVIGGVQISSQRTDVAQVPLVGSIPLIGHLFKRTSVSTSSQELLFFLTPRIIPN